MSCVMTLSPRIITTTTHMFYIQSSGIWGLTDELRKYVVSNTAAVSRQRVFVM